LTSVVLFLAALCNCITEAKKKIQTQLTSVVLIVSAFRDCNDGSKKEIHIRIAFA
jgi:hypothetical protein